jgi:hypothetical protein
MNIGDLVRIVDAPYSHPELYWTLAIILENLGKNKFGTDRVVLHCLLDGRQMKATVDRLDLVAN